MFFKRFPVVTKLILLHTVVVLYNVHHIKMACLLKGGGGAVKMLKPIYYKSSILYKPVA